MPVISVVQVRMLEIWKHSGFQKYFKNTGWLFFEKVIRMGVGMFVGAWVARYLGPTEYGLYNYAIGFASLFTITASLGLDGIVVRDLLNQKDDFHTLLGTAFFLRVCGGLLSLVFLVIAIFFAGHTSFENLLIFIVGGSVIFQSFNVIDSYFQSQVLSRYIVFASIISFSVSSALKVGGIIFDAPLIFFVWLVLFESLILMLGYVYFYAKQKSSIRHWRFEKAIGVRYLKDSWPLMLSSVFLIVQARIDQVMIKQIIGDAEVGLYSVSLRLIEAFGFLPVIISTSLYPAIAKAKQQSLAQYTDRLVNFYRLNFILFLIIAIPLFFLSNAIIGVLFGDAYVASAALLSLMSIRLFFTNMGTARGVFILIENLFVFSLNTMLLGTVVNIICNLVLIPLYSSQGAIIATIISFTVTIFGVDIWYRKTRSNVFLMIKSIFSPHKINLNL